MYTKSFLFFSRRLVGDIEELMTCESLSPGKVDKNAGDDLPVQSSCPSDVWLRTKSNPPPSFLATTLYGGSVVRIDLSRLVLVLFQAVALVSIFLFFCLILSIGTTSLGPQYLPRYGCNCNTLWRFFRSWLLDLTQKEPWNNHLSQMTWTGGHVFCNFDTKEPQESTLGIVQERHNCHIER